MIDTIVLTLKSGMFTILDHDKFSPSTKGFYEASIDYYRRWQVQHHLQAKPDI